MQSFIYQNFKIANNAAGKITIPADIFVATNLALVCEEKDALSVAAVRELIKLISYIPNSGKRVIIIPNADKMLIPAQNALLKTLEEPPEHTIFMLVAENPHAMLDTILSRCEVVHCKETCEDKPDKEYESVIKPVLSSDVSEYDKYKAITFLQGKSNEKEKVISELEKIFGNTAHQKYLGEAKRRLKMNANWNIVCNYVVNGE